jgi:hypothetical protein
MKQYSDTAKKKKEAWECVYKVKDTNCMFN